MARAMWKGSLAFGLVNIPVELYSATRDHRPKFRLLHAKDESPVRYERVCQSEGQAGRLGRSGQGLRVREGPVRRHHQGRLQDRGAREDEDDRHPRLRRSRRKSTSATSRRRITCSRQGGRSRLCAAARGDPRLGPDRHRQDHPARRAASRCGRGDRRRDRADDDALRRRARGPGRLPLPQGGGIRPAELKMARQLIDSLSAKWKPEKYTDEYRDNLMRVIQAKLKGKKPRLEERETPQQAEVVDLMARLRASLEGRRSRAKGSAGQAWQEAVDSRKRSQPQDRIAHRSAPTGAAPGGRCAPYTRLMRSLPSTGPPSSTGTAATGPRSRAIFDLIDPAAYYSRPIALRNPIVFYEGHLPAFSIISFLQARARPRRRRRAAGDAVRARHRSR